MNFFTNYLEKLGSNFLVSSMIPSLALVVASILVFDPIIHVSALFEQQSSIYQLVGFGLLLFIFTVIIGFTLTALNTYILKFYEGYVFFRHIPFMHRRMIGAHVRKAHQMIIKRKTLKRRIRNLQHPIDETSRTKRQLTKLKQQYYAVTAEYDHSYPQDLGGILPTQFGNILKASETYPGTRYGMDGVEFWPRLIQVIPAEQRSSIDNTRNELSFLVNMSVLSIVFYFLCVLAIFVSLAASPNPLSGPTVYFEIAGKSFRYIGAAFLAVACSAFFYKASIFSVGSFGLMIRSAYDLFRIDLLKRLRLKIPANSWEEFFTWQNINEFVLLGRHSLKYKKLEYHHPKEES